MKAARIMVFATCLCMAGLPGISSAGVRDDKPNLIGGEILGRGIIVTLNYERFVTNNFGLGGGFMAIGGSGGAVAVVPLYLSVVPGDIHSVYLSAGATLGVDAASSSIESQWVITTAVGYQYHSPNGFFVRPLFTLLVPAGGDSSDFLIWPGLTIGGSF